MTPETLSILRSRTQGRAAQGRPMSQVLLTTFLLAALTATAPAGQRAAERPPNIILIVADDLGWGDVGAYGQPTIRTPHLDRIAVEGQKWTTFYSGAPYCTPSRAGLLTGRLPVRSGLASETRTVLFADSLGGLPQSEVTIPELLKERGYATAMMGKWHLGHLPQYQPEQHGFDLYFGIPFSNDMEAVPGSPSDRIQRPKSEYFNVPVYSGGRIVERPALQPTLTHRYVEKSVQFIKANRERPFFLYIAHHMPHVPLFAHHDFEGRSARGPYGDVIEEIDAGVGRLRAVLAELRLERNTLVVFTSDNGPWLVQRDLAGSSGPFRDGKGTTFEGAVRVPALFLWPGTVKPGVVMEMGAFFDLLPTLAALAGVPVPSDRVLDGYDLTPVLRGTGPSPRRAYFYYRGSLLQAVRSDVFKVHFFTRPEGHDKVPERVDPPWLFNLDHDPSEQFDVARDHPEVVAELRRLAEEHKRGVVPVEDQVAKRGAAPAMR
jgi:arylsulfatase A